MKKKEISMRNNKKIFFYFLILFFSISFINAEILFNENFDDEDINQSYSWHINNNKYYFNNGQLNADGLKIDSTDRYLSQFDYFLNFSSDNLRFSFDGLLKEIGNPQEGRGIIISIIGDNGRYDLRIQNGPTSSFNINKNSLSFGYGTDYLFDYIVTNFTPSKDRFFNLRADRINKKWYFYVDDVLIGIHIDTLNITNFSKIHMPAVGSVIIDNVYIENLDIKTNDSNLYNNSNNNTSNSNLNIVSEELLKYAPVFYLHPLEYYEPREIESMLNLSFLMKGNFLSENTLIKENPIFYNDIQNLNSDYYLDLQNVDINLDYLPKTTDFDNFKPAIYGREINYNNRSHYQYYIFYPFQKRSLMSHEGDWELVQVNIDTAGKIESVEYFFDLFKLVYYDLNKVEFINNTHLVVLVALGSHNNYANFDNLVFENPYMFFQNFLLKLKNLESLSKEGKILKPNIFEKNEDREILYELKTINEIPLNFQGFWGQYTDKVLKRPPKGPAIDPRFERKWRHPEDYAYNPDFPFFSFFLYSPVDFIVYNKSNEQITEFSEELLFLHKEKKVVIVKGNDYKLFLEGKDNGFFSLDIFLYDNETNKGVMLSYKNITTKECSKGYLDSNFNSSFVLFFDIDCDDKYEKFLPSENITLNYEYILLDVDKDGISDIVDNCVDIYNPEQNDFNNDSLGDACDNPKYYKEKVLIYLIDKKQDLLAEIGENCLFNNLDDDCDESFEFSENNKKESYLLNLAIRGVNKSLDTKYWEDEFKIKSIKVFLYEIYSLKHLEHLKNKTLYNEVAPFLVKADKLIIDNILLDYKKIKSKNKYFREKIKYNYNKAIEELNKGNYEKSIFYFMKIYLFFI